MQAPEGAALYNLYALADRLKKSVTEVRAYPAAEIAGWSAYFALNAASGSEASGGSH